VAQKELLSRKVEEQVSRFLGTMLTTQQTERFQYVSRGSDDPDRGLGKSKTEEFK